MSQMRFRHRRRLHHIHTHLFGPAESPASALTLADLRPGQQARLLSFSPEIPPERLTQLQSYGLLPDCHIDVLQNWPVIVIQVEHTELAVENDLARQILIADTPG